MVLHRVKFMKNYENYAKIISISSAKQNLLKLARRNRDLGESFVIVKDSEPISALIPFDEYESLLETVEILENEPNIKKKLRSAEQEIKKGQYVTWDSGKVKKRA